MQEVTYLRPENIQDAVQLYRTTPGCRLLAGGTDLKSDIARLDDGSGGAGLGGAGGGFGLVLAVKKEPARSEPGNRDQRDD